MGEKVNPDTNWGWNMINGTCNSRPFTMGPKDFRACGEARINVDMSSVTYETPHWDVGVRAMPVYDRISGPHTRLDVSMRLKVDEKRFIAGFGTPHGIIGQSYDGDGLPRRGAKDEYPTSGKFRTKAMAEGAIEGIAQDYEMPYSYATQFKFSRFEKKARPS